MTVHVSIQPGVDASYPWRQIGAADGTAPPGRGLDYYLSPAEAGGEPPGRWAGRGLAVLGFTPGQVVDRVTFEKLFGEHLDPRDVSGRTRLGRAPQQFASEADIYASLLAAEPHASEGRKAELRALAAAQTRHAVPFWDVTMSVSKSVSVFHGSLLAKAERARQAGDTAQAALWERKAAKVWAAIGEAKQAMLGYLQDEAGYTRTGYHRGSGAESRAELGKWERASNWIIGTFDQHTSRDRDPQLHAHNLVLNKVQADRDGKWRKLDSKGLYRHRHAAAMIAAVTLKWALTRDFGVEWVPRTDGHGWEIKGVSQEIMDRYSSRRQTITAEARKIAEQREREWGRAPSAWQLDRIQRDITYRTRQAKPGQPLDIPALLREWEDKARAADLAALETVYDTVMAEASAPARAREETVARLARNIGLELIRERRRTLDAVELAQVERFASWVSLRGYVGGPFDIAALARAFEAAQRADTGKQRDIRREIARAQAQAQAQQADAARLRAQAQMMAYPVAGAEGLTEAVARQVMAEAVAAVQAQLPTWTKADLIAHLAECLPAHANADRATLEALAERALAGASGERVVALSAPEWPRVPDSLRRADGESVFRPHGADRYASQAQLTLEERLLAQAQAPAAPRLEPETAARMLGADRDRLEAQLRSEPTTAAALSDTTGSGLRMDQAAAAYHVLTSPRRAEVMVGPAGTGKTRTAAELARIWSEAGMGPAVALTTSSNARNVIQTEAAAHGVSLAAYNTAEWLGHSQHAREDRRPVDLVPGSLVIVDEASMMSLPDLAAVVRRASEHGAKVVVTGDPLQLQAVDSGGGMTLLVGHAGYVQLSEASRFRHGWEREATLRLRDGDATVLADYRQHDRLHAGEAETILDDAARAYLHDRLNGHDTVLMAETEALAAELSRRARDDLIRWGLVSDGPSVRLRDGGRASAGDWIMARRNDNLTDAGEQGRKLANRDILRIIDVDPDGTATSIQVQRLTGRDAGTGQEQWSAPFEMSHAYLWNWAHLAYAVTFHTAEGRTVDSGIAVFTGDENRQAVNVALTRGRDRNEVYVISGWRFADPKPGTRPAPELTRQARLDRERAGLPGQDPRQQQTQHATQTAEQILAACLDRDGQQTSATDTREAEWSDADRLDVLGVQWQHVTRDAAQRRYEAALHAALSETDAQQVMNDQAATWLWRSLREAEAAGLDGPATLQRAVESGTLADAESVAKVLDWRIRQYTAGMPALAAQSWAALVPQTGDAATDRYATELAQAMEDRQRRLGEHAAEHRPSWIQLLGSVPDDPVARADWEHKAAAVAAYREMWGYAHPYDPIGPRPGQHSPEARTSWQAAAEALGYTPGDLHEHSDGQLWAWRSAFSREMAWAPDYKGDDLATVRGEIRRTQIEADRARRNAEAADTTEARQRLEERAATLAQWERMTQGLADRLAEAHAGYEAWEAATAPTRERAVAADAELRRRHPGLLIEPLRAPGPKREPETPPAQPSAQSQPERADTHAERVVGDRMDQITARMREISARLDDVVMRKAREAQEKAAEITSMQVYPDDPDAAPMPAWKTELEARQREAVRHDPLPRVPASEAIAPAEPTVTGPEAAD